MDVIVLSGLIGSIFSIVTVFLPDNFKSKRLTMMTFVLVISLLSCFTIHLNDKLFRIERTSQNAEDLLEKQFSEFTPEGFILASLAFLEQSQDLYPDSYSRAKIIYENYSISPNKSAESAHVSFELSGLLRGVAIMSGR